ncbi:hypothetical protein OPT61_g9477 [Boeremia exigua]|uniref:Uncharacterized protein n=1 Tax=Boeremia exigua TaxID=749465 RepID=A0ACC2HU93_9PLEO|nr:hypothetical protein OPT61_g9477 [Boeremia exigua]
MTYEIEDEVDWSDGTLDEPPRSISTGVSGDSGYVSPDFHEDDGLDYLFEDQEEDEYTAALGTALPPVTSRPAVTRAQRARIGVHLNRRQPCEQDFAHFALYQANQKAYEATFLKHFANHVLHPSQIDRCFLEGNDAYSSIQKYAACLSTNINAITNKMVWNAHCRAVNLLGNAGKEGAPFWDINSFDRDVFAEFDFNNPTPVVHRMNESWHRTAPKPPMVRYTTTDYPVGQHCSPFEEIDEVADTLFNPEAFGGSLPAGRIVRRPTSRKGKGEGLPGASVRDSSMSTRNDNWLAPLVPPVAFQSNQQTSAEVLAFPRGDQVDQAAAEPQISGDFRQFQCDSPGDRLSQTAPAVALQPIDDPPPVELTRLELLFQEFGADALSDHRHACANTLSQEHVNQVPTWPSRLLADHKRRLTQKSPQMLQKALPGIRSAVSEALSRGYRPVDPGFEDILVDIEEREQSGTLQKHIYGTFHTKKSQQEAPKPQEPYHGIKRRRDQIAPIRMLNEPVELTKKKRKAFASAASVEGRLQGTRNAPRASSWRIFLT